MTIRRTLAATSVALFGLPLLLVTPLASPTHADTASATATLAYDCSGPAGPDSTDVDLTVALDPEEPAGGEEAALTVDVDGSEFDLRHTPHWYLRVTSARVELQLYSSPDQQAAVPLSTRPSLFDDTWTLTGQTTVPDTADEFTLDAGELVITQNLVDDTGTTSARPTPTPEPLDGARTEETTCTVVGDDTQIAAWPVAGAPEPSPTPTPSPTPPPSPTGSPAPSPTSAPPQESPTDDPTPEATASPSPDEAAPPRDGGDTLPVSGTALTGLIIAAALVVLGGVGALFLARRGRGFGPDPGVDPDGPSVGDSRHRVD
ncbi:hypothetical protein RIF23_05795 [Lipingzhangella sp. LS1_29]|uniref:Uncharacterized protein n=1 Tax=Lipingzhangella rawalii TaxID=2055835 RepID=A0ABU2H4N5_9ACTN|nr:hypothetical protein [Lipingzhangella rawalii]MDS1269805.1 hypothetical protein [Lipingzhangella rawalii]